MDRFLKEKGDWVRERLFPTGRIGLLLAKLRKEL